jgi:hypothetical protein
VGLDVTFVNSWDGLHLDGVGYEAFTWSSGDPVAFTDISVSLL